MSVKKVASVSEKKRFPMNRTFAVPLQGSRQSTLAKSRPKLNGGLGTDIVNGITTGLSKDTISDSTKVIDTSFAFDFAPRSPASFEPTTQRGRFRLPAVEKPIPVLDVDVWVIMLFGSPNSRCDRHGVAILVPW